MALHSAHSDAVQSFHLGIDFVPGSRQMKQLSSPKIGRFCFMRSTEWPIRPMILRSRFLRGRRSHNFDFADR